MAVARLRDKPPLTMDDDLRFQHWLGIAHRNKTQDQTWQL